MLSKIEYQELFNGYIINKECPFRINLPKKLLYHILGGLIDERYIDNNWYKDEANKDHPFSLFAIENKINSYTQDYNDWRNSTAFNQSTSSETHNDFTNFNEILDYAATNKHAVVIGESHIDSTPTAILMHNLHLLKEKKAILFLEGFFAELQEELNKSVEQKKPTPLIEAFLTNSGHHESPTYYTHRNLIRACIQIGIPLIACDNQMTQILAKDCIVVENEQTGTISRMTLNYEYDKARNYAREKFPDYQFPVCLVGNAHCFTFHSTHNESEGIHPGIVDILGELCLCQR